MYKKLQIAGQITSSFYLYTRVKWLDFQDCISEIIGQK